MSAWLTETITIGECGLRAPEIANVAYNNNPFTGELVRFTPDVIDPDRDDVSCLPSQQLSYHWRLISTPAGSEATLVNATLEAIDLTPDVPGEYRLSLIATDDLGLSSDEYQITLNADECGGAAPVLTSISSDAIDDLAWELGVPVRLDSDASDPDEFECGLEGNLMYHWSLTEIPSGSEAVLNDPRLAVPSLTPDVEGDYSVSLTVADMTGRGATLTRTFTASACGGQSPEALIGLSSPFEVNADPADPNPSAVVSIGEIVQFDGGDSLDPDEACGRGGVLTYHWTLLRVPPQSQAELSLANGVTPWFVADVQGNYKVQLIVSDGQSSSEAAIFEIDAN
jgi:hypothetical protein